MKHFIKNRGEEVGSLVWYTLLALLIVAILSFGWLGISRVVYPWWLSIQREAVEDSKSYTDSTNIAMANYIREYHSLDSKIAEAKGDQFLIAPYQAQQSAILNQMCQIKATMNDVAPDTQVFLSQHGGCQ